MSRSIPTVILLVVAVAAAVVATNGVAVSQEGARTKPGDVACVNWPIIFERARTIAAANEWSEKEVMKLKTRQDEFRVWVTAKREEIELLKQGSLEYETLKDEMERRLWDRESEDAFVKRRVEARQITARLELDKRARQVIGEYAKKHGIRIVHAFHQMEIDTTRLKQPAQLAGAIASRSVLFWDERVDITEEILSILDG